MAAATGATNGNAARAVEAAGKAISQEFGRFASRRSVVHSTRGMVACTQPLAARCGLEVLRAGGNAADAAVAVAAGLNVTEPCSTGIGGDMFMLYRDASTGKISALNGSGRSGSRYTLDLVRKELGLDPDLSNAEADSSVADVAALAAPPAAPETNVGDAAKMSTPPFSKIPFTSVHAVTVPGAAAGWVDSVERFGSGRVTMEQVLGPAVDLAENGFPVSEITARYWQLTEGKLRAASPNFAEMLKKDPDARDGARAPAPGEIMKNPALGRTFRTLAAEGKAGFYSGRIAEQIVKVCQDLGGHHTLADLSHHMETGSEDVEPISLKFRGQGLSRKSRKRKSPDDEPLGTLDGGLELWEHPPNGQGIVALMALGILQELEKQGKIPTFRPEDFNTTPYLHAIIEALRLAFTDGNWFVADPNVSKVPTQELISEEYLSKRAVLFSPSEALKDLAHGDPSTSARRSPALNSCDTVYFCVVDSEGNAASFINSNYAGFGTYIIPQGCGFTLQNRGSGFSLTTGHPNALEPRKRPYHTIIPGMVTSIDDGSLHSVYGVMGGYMQPQGHVQTLLGQVVAGLDPQEALDAPRVCVEFGMTKGGVEGWTVFVEQGMADDVVTGLKDLGHNVELVTGNARGVFGRGQIIKRSEDPVDGTVVWSAGSDMRGDGAAFPL